jgi:hypothetical protein
MQILFRMFHKIFLHKINLKKLNSEQRSITIDNIKKHTYIFLIMSFSVIYSFFIIYFNYIDKIDTVITSLLGVLFISGAAWFAITFGAIPLRFADFAIDITAFLFASFALSMGAVFAAAIIAVPYLSPILFIAFYSLYNASVKYDIVDALKIGIDDAVLKHAKVGRIYFTRELKK